MVCYPLLYVLRPKTGIGGGGSGDWPGVPGSLIYPSRRVSWNSGMWVGVIDKNVAYGGF